MYFILLDVVFADIAPLSSQKKKKKSHYECCRFISKGFIEHDKPLPTYFLVELIR